jgi:endonuclease-3 related protein
MKRSLQAIYKKLYSYFGPQSWWPAQSPFEVMVGAILTQNTNWSNVEKAMRNLKKEKLLSAYKLAKVSRNKLGRLIKSAGYYNIKARRLNSFLKFFLADYRGSIKRMSLEDTQGLRARLLSVNGIGQETADSILLYALNRPIFVIDAYTKRIFSRHHFIKDNEDYGKVQALFMDNLKSNSKLFNEYHALLVRLGKEFCLKSNPRCKECPLR